MIIIRGGHTRFSAGTMCGSQFIAAMSLLQSMTGHFFQTYADMVVAVEWNPDILYFGSIMDTLARDLHCYCIQAILPIMETAV